jgi:hypothetical protein
MCREKYRREIAIFLSKYASFFDGNIIDFIEDIYLFLCSTDLSKCIVYEEYLLIEPAIRSIHDMEDEITLYRVFEGRREGSDEIWWEVTDESDRISEEDLSSTLPDFALSEPDFSDTCSECREELIFGEYSFLRESIKE